MLELFTCSVNLPSGSVYLLQIYSTQTYRIGQLIHGWVRQTYVMSIAKDLHPQKFVLVGFVKEAHHLSLPVKEMIKTLSRPYTCYSFKSVFQLMFTGIYEIQVLTKCELLSDRILSKHLIQI